MGLGEVEHVLGVSVKVGVIFEGIIIHMLYTASHLLLVVTMIFLLICLGKETVGKL